MTQERIDAIGLVRRYPFPGDHGHDDPGGCAFVSLTVLHDGQDLLVDAGSSDDLVDCRRYNLLLRTLRDLKLLLTAMLLFFFKGERLTHLAIGHPCVVLPSLPV